MHPFVLASANDPETAIANHADDPELAFIAGGTDLIGLMKDRAALPRRLLDINKLPDMAGAEAVPDGGRCIGALAPVSEAAPPPDARPRSSLCAEARPFSPPRPLPPIAQLGGGTTQRPR